MNAADDRTTHRARLKQAELASGVGAGILGAGLGALAAQYVGVGPYALPFLGVGVATHARGMLERHRLDAMVPRVWWAEALYWLRRGLLLAIAGLVLLRR